MSVRQSGRVAVAEDTGRQPGSHYRAAHPRRPHPRPPSPRIRTAHPVTGYDGGHWHRAAASQTLSSSAPKAATSTATQFPDQSGAPVTTCTVTGYDGVDGGRRHRATPWQPLSSSAPMAATPTATQSTDQNRAPVTGYKKTR